MPSKPFIDAGFNGIEFTKALLESSDFTVETLKHFASPGVPTRKSALAHDVAERLHASEVSPQEVVAHYANQPRIWLSLKLGAPHSTPVGPPPEDLLFSFGDRKWYGPLRGTREGSGSWYLRIVEVDATPPAGAPAYLRWPVVAQVAGDFLALHWDGFSLPSSLSNSPSQFSFWTHIPHLFDELRELVGGKWEHPPLNRLVLRNLWNRYLADSRFIWRHIRIRAESRGVALNASSSTVTDINVAGLQALTATLAKSTSIALDQRLSAAELETVEAALLRTLIQEWGTNSYEFSLDRAFFEDGGDKMFRAHCYFGERPLLKTQDSLQHLKCYSSYGGSHAALSFVLEHCQ